MTTAPKPWEPRDFQCSKGPCHQQTAQHLSEKIVFLQRRGLTTSLFHKVQQHEAACKEFHQNQLKRNEIDSREYCSSPAFSISKCCALSSTMIVPSQPDLRCRHLSTQSMSDTGRSLSRRHSGEVATLLRKFVKDVSDFLSFPLKSRA